jgi:hypothetical protein
MNDIVPANEVAKRGVAAVGCVAGGVLLFVLGALPSIMGIIAGSVVAIVGFTAISSKDPAGRFSGIVAAGAGILAVAANLPFIKTVLGGAARFLLGMGAFALFALGVWNLILFLRGMKSRA